MTANVMNDTLTGEELALLDRVAAEAIEPMAPPSAVRARILEAVRVTPQFDESVPGEHESRTLRAGEGRWSTLAPVAPAHDHEGTEDTFVVRGSCRIGALGLAAGDFHHVEAGAHHGDVVASSDGCVLLITFALEEAA
jgi:hypothetical protein